jgi:lipopolysaccharide export system protein LptA
MKTRLAAVLAGLLMLTAADPLKAETGKVPAAPVPVDISANEMEILDADRKVIFRGAVDATRGTTNLRADLLTVTYAEVTQADGASKTDATDLDATGNVTIKTPRETITGDWAKFNPQTNRLVMGGAVRVVQGATVLSGNQLTADLDSGKIQMTGGRVRGSFLPE